MLLSICIPSYNRPIELLRLLESVDCDSNKVEIIVCEDLAPKRSEVREIAVKFKGITSYKFKYFENVENLGYDANIRKLIELADGDFIMFMGDDDRFFPGALDQFLVFLERNRGVGYVLRSYYGEHPDGTLETFKYLSKERILSPSIENCSFLFKRTVSIAGVTFKRTSALAHATNYFDGSLLYQLYLLLEITFVENSIYCDIPVAIVAQSFRDDKPHFGASKNESKFEPGKVTSANSIAFTKGFFEISSAFDLKYNTNITKLIQLDLSKYSYPILSIQRKNGFFHFLKYSYNLAKHTSINRSWHYYFYCFVLLFLGEKICDTAIIYIKNKVGFTPKL